MIVVSRIDRPTDVVEIPTPTLIYDHSRIDRICEERANSERSEDAEAEAQSHAEMMYLGELEAMEGEYQGD